MQVWNVPDGATDTYPLPPIQLNYPTPDTNARPPIIRLRLGGSQARTLVRQYGNRVTVWDLTDPAAPTFQAEVSFPDLRSLDVHVVADSARALAARLDHEELVTVRDVLAGFNLFSRHVNGASSVRFIDAPGRPLLAVGAPRVLHVLDTESGEDTGVTLPTKLPEHAAVGQLDGANVLAALNPDGLRLFDLRTGKETMPTIEMSTTASGVAWGRVDDRDVVITAHFATVRVWNPRTGRKITELRLGTRIGAMSLDDTDNGRLIIAVSGPGIVLTELGPASQLDLKSTSAASYLPMR
jgi:hypothetical protein